MVNENFLGFGVGVGIEPSTFHLSRKTGPGYGNLGYAAGHIKKQKLQKEFSGMTKLVIVSSNVDVTTKYCRKKDSQHCVTAPFFATIYHDNRNHLGCCNAFWITGKVMLLVPYFRKIANISIVSPQSCPIESYRDSIVEKCCCKLFCIFTFFKHQSPVEWLIG